MGSYTVMQISGVLKSNVEKYHISKCHRKDKTWKNFSQEENKLIDLEVPENTSTKEENKVRTPPLHFLLLSSKA